MFYPTLFGMSYRETKDGNVHEIQSYKFGQVEVMIRIRKDYCYGLQRDYFDKPNVIGWTREGINGKHHSGIAVLISNAESGRKQMTLGERNAGRIMTDATGSVKEYIALDRNGTGEFMVNAQGVSVWI